ncbi:MAG: MFS transporter [Micromonosporaceae bacterium]|nr:MFS transporter [Micromonosporaceae bacterium]
MRTARGWIRETAGGLPATFWYLWTGTLVNRLGAFVSPFLAIYLTTQRGFSAAQAGLVLGGYGAGAAGGVLLGGVLADRWGRRRTLLTAHISAAAAMLVLGFAQDRYAILGVASLLGLATEMARPAFSAMMVDIVPERDRLRAFTLNYWAINVGFACSAVLAGLAAEANYLSLFLIDAATTLVTAGIVCAKVRETHPARTARLSTRSTAEPADSGLRVVFADRVFMGLVLLTMLLALQFMQHVATLPIAMQQDGLSPATYGSVIALNGVLIVAGQLFVPRLVGEHNRSRVLAVGAVVTGAGFGLTAFADHAWLYALTVLVWTVGEMISSPSNSTLVAELSPAALRGRYQGVFSLAWSAASFGAPIVGGFVQEHAGNTVLWLGCAGLGVVTAVGHLLSGPARERRAAQLRAPQPPVREEAMAASAG